MFPAEAVVEAVAALTTKNCRAFGLAKQAAKRAGLPSGRPASLFAFVLLSLQKFPNSREFVYGEGFGANLR